MTVSETTTTIIDCTVHWITRPLPPMWPSGFCRLRLLLCLQNPVELPIIPILALNLVKTLEGGHSTNRSLPTSVFVILFFGLQSIVFRARKLPDRPMTGRKWTDNGGES